MYRIYKRENNEIIMIVRWVLTELFGALFIVLIGIYLYFKLIIFNYWRRKGVPYEEPMFPAGNITDAILNKKSIRKLSFSFIGFKKKSSIILYYFKTFLVIILQPIFSEIFTPNTICFLLSEHIRFSNELS